MEAHLSDEEMIRLSDRELSRRMVRRASDHLTGCPRCRSRLARFDSASAAFLELHENEVNSLPGSFATDRAALKAKLEIERRIHSRSASLPRKQSMAWAACLLLVLAVSSIWSFRRSATPNQIHVARNEQGRILPLKSITPGAKRPVTMEEICTTANDNDPPVATAMEEEVLRKYGLSSLASSSQKYRLDYLISPSLGGTADLSNLWPQPASTSWNSEMKDRLEDHLHELVCRGDLRLSVAQDEISTNWIAAYRKYFATPA